jgi:hypothetical protein
MQHYCYCVAHTNCRFEEVRNDAARSPPFGANRQHSNNSSSANGGSAGNSCSYTAAAAAASSGINDDDLLSAGDDSFDEDTQWKTATTGTGSAKTTGSSRGRTDNEGPGEGIRWKRGEQVRYEHILLRVNLDLQSIQPLYAVFA